MNWQKLQRIAFTVFLISIASSLVAYKIYGPGFDLDNIRNYLKDFGIWAPLIFVFIYIAGTIFMPSTPFMAAAGILFGFEYGLIYTIIGGFFSSLSVFYISRKSGKTKFEQALSNKYLEHVGKYNKRLESGGFFDLILLRIMPIMPFNVLNILMGVSKIKTEEYIAGTIIGLIPSNVIAVYFGNIIYKIF